jgi:hypothetical protein
MPLIPALFEPPLTVDLDGFTAKVLTPQFADLDFEAVTASANTIRHVFGPENFWPSQGMGYEENKADLARHERQFHERSAFAYALLDPTGSRYLGCLYLKPIKSKTGRDKRHEQFSAQAFFWLSTLHQEVGEAALQAAITDWLAAVWGLTNVAWPGRNPSWKAWSALAAQPASALLEEQPLKRLNAPT